MKKIVVKELTKIFGGSEKLGLEMIQQDKTREEILKEKNLIVGVHNASFAIEEGEIFVVMGLSGSGKSTLIRMLNRLIEPSHGHVLVDGQDINSLSQEELVRFRRNNISMVFQSFALMPHLNILENTCLGLEFSGVPKGEREKVAVHQLANVGLAGRENSYPHELSGGMQQRVGLARALTSSSQILLMDEAFSALDPLIRSEMQDQLLKLHKEDKRTIIFVSHNLDEALKIGDRIAIMNDGKIVQIGTPKEIIQQPADSYVRAFFRNVDSTSVITAEELATRDETMMLDLSMKSKNALEKLLIENQSFGHVVDKNGKFVGVVSVDRLRDAETLEQVLQDPQAEVLVQESMKNILSSLAQIDGSLPVVADNREYIGSITKNRFIQKLASLKEASDV